MKKQRKSKIGKMIDKVEFEAEFWKSKENGFGWTERFGELLIQLHQIVMAKPNFHNYKREIKEEMISYSYKALFSGLRNFDKSKGDFFPYIYSAVHMNFCSYLLQHYRHQTRYYKYIYEKLLELEHRGMLMPEQKEVLIALKNDPYVNGTAKRISER